jgi:UDP-N-acetylmuramoylalanine--D-glutamate ligase
MDMSSGTGIVNWVGKRVLVIGAARQGIALAHYLAFQGAQVVMNDRKPAEELEAAMDSLAQQHSAGRIEWSLGGHPLSLLDGIDLVCPSGGVPLNLPLIQEARVRGIPLSNDSQIFLDVCPCLTIGITGSAGKTTTTSLVGKIAEISTETRRDSIYRKAWIGGNIGNPLVSAVGELQPDDLVVMELSSFQLELMTRSVNIACILNITPNHLDRHASMADYTAAKRRILEFQSEGDSAVLGTDDPGAWDLLGNVRGRRYAFGKAPPSAGLMGAFFDGEWVCTRDGKTESQIVRQSEIPLRGWHNLENVMAACALSLAAGLSVAAIREGIILHRSTSPPGGQFRRNGTTTLD